MAKIVDAKSTYGKKVKCEVHMDVKEALQLAGNLKNVRIFPAKTPTIRASIIESGTKKSTKYFQIPDSFVFRHEQKKGWNFDAEERLPSCIRFETDNKDFLIYVIPKE